MIADDALMKVWQLTIQNLTASLVNDEVRRTHCSRRVHNSFVRTKMAGWPWLRVYLLTTPQVSKQAPFEAVLQAKRH